MKSLFKLCALATIFAPLSFGQVILTGDVFAGTGMIQIIEDISFSVTTDGSFSTLVFDEWVTSDGNWSYGSLTPNTLAYSINEGAVQTASGLLIIDNLSYEVGDITANDGYLFLPTLEAIPVSAGDTLVIKAGSWDIPAISEFNPGTVGTFAGEVFIANVNGLAITDIVPLPEPASALLCGLGALGIALLRRKFR